MYQADLKHSERGLQKKLEKLYALNRSKAIDLSFRPPYLNLLHAFGDPQNHLPPIVHVAGTNGKGSTIAMLRSILEAAGYKVHSYTSPHLFEFNERIALAGEPICNELLESLIDEAIALNDNAEITFFEITTAIAFEAFRRTPADIVLLEVGLGGRLDCTNIITKPYVSLINTISYDHMDFLGNSLDQIAKEKAGIMKYDTPCIIGYQLPEIIPNIEKTPMDIFVDEAVDKKTPLYCANKDWSIKNNDESFTFTFQESKKTYPIPNLMGQHQIRNAGLALAALSILQQDFSVSDEAITHGLQHVQWQGRMEQITSGALKDALPEHTELWYDGGHNDSAGDAIGVILEQWKNAQINESKDTHVILGMKADKNPRDFLQNILPHIKSLTLTKVNDIGACITKDHIEPTLKGHPVHYAGQTANLADAIKKLKVSPLFKANDRVLVCGSFYLREQF